MQVKIWSPLVQTAMSLVIIFKIDEIWSNYDFEPTYLPI